MTVFNRAMATARRRPVSLLAVLLIAAGAGIVLPASASNAPVSVGSPVSGRMVSASAMGARHTRSVVSLQRSPARRFHRGHDMFAGFFPFGFFPGSGWPDQPELTVVDQGDQPDWRSPPYWVRLDRYEPPTVEKAPSGVTIIRGPGSHHAVLLR